MDFTVRGNFFHQVINGSLLVVDMEFDGLVVAIIDTFHLDRGILHRFLGIKPNAKVLLIHKAAEQVPRLPDIDTEKQSVECLLSRCVRRVIHT